MVKLLQEAQPKWFHSDRDLQVGDFVYLRKNKSITISKGPWTMGQVSEVSVFSDLVIRRAGVQYYNAGGATAQHISRSVRSLVKLFNVDERGWREDMERIRKICEDTVLDLSMQPTPPAKP